MSDLLADLEEIEAKAKKLHAKCETQAINQALEKLIEAADNVGAAHSGSPLGYQAYVYYKDLRRPPAGAYFDRQWGFDGVLTTTRGEWREFSSEWVFDQLKATRTNPTYDDLWALSKAICPEYDELRDDLLLVLEACRSASPSEFLDNLKDQMVLKSPPQYMQELMPPPPPMTQDMKAGTGGTRIPPHVAFKANVQFLRGLFMSTGDIERAARRAKEYLAKTVRAKSMLSKSATGSRVFIGHGRSGAWLELKNYLQDQYNLPCDDYNRYPTPGKTTVDRLNMMLNEACFAFVVLTAEDERKDGTMQARMNVIHEAGLFQGRLGFEKAIIVLEDGCDKFSNIDGLGQIRFEKDKIKGSFHEVTDVLRREGIIS